MASQDLILIIDQGTTGSKAIAFDQQGKMVARGYSKMQLQFPEKDWVEVKPQDVEKSVAEAITECLKNIDVNRLAYVGVTNQRETCTFYDVKNKSSLYPFIVWQDRRTRAACEKLPAEMLANKTGLRPHPYFSASKLNWMLTHQRPKQDADYRVMTIDSFVCYLLTGKKDVHVTDPTNASRTLLYNIHENTWDDELCSLFEVPKDWLPEVVPNGEVLGKTEKVFGLPAGIPIVSPLGDQQAAWVGCGALFEPTLKMTIGTGSFAIGPSAHEPYKRGLLQTIGYHDKQKKHFGYEAVVFCSGMVTEWLMNGGWIKKYEDIDQLPFPPTIDADFYPLFTDMGTPYWKGSPMGASMSHLRLQHKPQDVVQAAMMGVAFQNRLALEQYDLEQVPKLYMDGGVSQFKYMQNMMAALLEKDIYVSNFADMTSFGVWVSIMRHQVGADDKTLQKVSSENFQPTNTAHGNFTELKKHYVGWKKRLDTLMS